MSDLLNPKICGIRMSMLLYLYRRRLRSHPTQELLAGSGIAVAVALVFGVLVANTSLTSSAGALIREVVGAARVELVARSPAGFEEGLAGAVSKLPGVDASAAVLRANVTVRERHAQQAIQLLGVTPSIAALGSFDARNFGAGGFRLSDELVLPASVASAIGAGPGSEITVTAAGNAERARVGAVLSGSLFGALASSPVAITPLPFAQRLVGLPGRVSQVLVEPRAGADRRVSAELRGLAGGGLQVAPADNELRLLEQAIEPNSQSTELFSAISVMVGFLLALSAMLLTMPERRRFVADLRIQGFDRRQVLLLLSSQALVLGACASLLGIALGEALSSAFFDRVPTYLTEAFPIGAGQLMRPSTVLAAWASGVLATVLASLTPIFDLSEGRPVDAAFRESGAAAETIGERATKALGLAGMSSIAIVTILVLAEPETTILGGIALALTTLMLIPALFMGISRALPWLGDHLRSSALVVAISELRATSMRAVALAGVAGLAVYGSIAIGGARGDLLRGIDRATVQYFATADLWVGTGQDIFNVNRFQLGSTQATIARVPSVASVRVYQGGLLDVGRRRLWIRARSAQDSQMIEASQLLRGNLARATALLRRGGWAAISSAFANEHDLHLGGFFTLPTPAGPAPFRVAAIMTNSGWPPGAITINNTDYARYWRTTDPSALEVNLRPGVSEAAGKRAVAVALGDRPGLMVLTRGERERQSALSARQGLQTLDEISVLLLIAAGLAVASALSTAVWQRRTRLASLKIQGYETRQLWRALLLESVITVGIGCTIGGAVGIYGHALAGRWLTLTTGFPAPFAVAPTQITFTLVLISAVALMVIALPGLAAASVPARAGFQE